MMADLRLVLVHSIESGSNAFFEALLEYVSEPNPSTLLVLSGGRFPAVKKGGKNWKSRLQHAVRKVGHVVNIMMKDVDPIRFAQSHARSLGKELGRREASMLVSVVGADLAVISQELEKVSLFVGDQVEIRSEDIAEACSLLAEEGLWELTAGLAEANSDRALRALYRRLEEGVAPHQLLGQVTWQVREMLAIAELLRTGSTPADVGRQHRARPQVIAKIQEQARHRLAQPAATLEKIASANRAMNLHRAGGRRILEALLIELCA